MMNHYYIGSFLGPFFLAMLLMPLIRRFALEGGVIEQTSEPQSHGHAVPLGGGLGIFVGLIVAIVVITSLITFIDLRSVTGLMAGTILVFLIGIYDDIFKMGIWPRMLGQIIAALIFLSFLERVPTVVPIPVYLAFGTVWIVGLQNAFDFLDNMDGLCAGVSLSIAIGLGVLFVLKGMPLFAVISFALAGGALGFLRFNLPPAGIYLGSTGSLLLGFALSCLAIVHLTSSRSLSMALSPLLIIAYPIFDLTFVTVSRLSEGRRVYLGARDHSAQKISFMGLTRKATVMTILAVNLILVILGVILFFIAESPYQTLIIVVLAFILAFAGTHLYRNILYLRHRISFILVDLAAINLAFLAYLFIKYHGAFAGPAAMIVPKDLVIPLAWINVFWIIIYSAGGLYDLPMELRFSNHVKALLRLIIIGFLIFAVATYRSGEGLQVSLSSLGLFAVLLILSDTLFRLAFYSFLGGRHRKSKMDAVIVKLRAGGLCDTIFQTFGEHYCVRGYVGEPPGSFEGFLGPAEKLGDVLRDNHIARVVIDLPDGNYDNLTPIFNSAFYMETRYLTHEPNNANLKGLNKYHTRYSGIYFISNSQTKIFTRLLKRIFDFFISGAILGICLPYIAIKLLRARYDKVSAFHNVSIVTRGGNERFIGCVIGEDGRPRFRNLWGLLSVFKGDFSLVGATITVSDGEEASMPGQWRKYLAKPGLWGPGYSGRTPKERFDLDLEYIEKASLLRDLGVIFRQMIGSSSIKVDEGA
jgi:UDP-GlcNAc:undecaprenyl-phosphate/decaprenyl-phosphate GlcNAc-1-phosphate transferase